MLANNGAQQARHGELLAPISNRRHQQAPASKIIIARLANLGRANNSSQGVVKNVAPLSRLCPSSLFCVLRSKQHQRSSIGAIASFYLAYIITDKRVPHSSRRAIGALRGCAQKHQRDIAKDVCAAVPPPRRGITGMLAAWQRHPRVNAGRATPLQRRARHRVARSGR